MRYINKLEAQVKVLKVIVVSVIAAVALMASGLVEASQTPTQIVAAEKDAGNFGACMNSGDLRYCMKDVVVSGENEVTYNYEYPSFLSARFNQIKDKQVIAVKNTNFKMSALVVSLAKAIENSPVDLENYNNGTVYKFSYTASSDASVDVAFSRPTVITIKHK